MARIRQSLTAAIISISSTAVFAQDADINNILSGISEDAQSITTLQENLDTLSEAEVQVIFRKIDEIAETRPDLADMVIVHGLGSKNDVLRHQALWLTLSRAKSLVCQINFEKTLADKESLRKRIGGVVTLSFYEADPKARSIRLVSGNSDQESRQLSVVGDNVNFATYGNNYSLSGSLSLSEDGRMLSGPIDYRYFSTTYSTYCDIPLL